jgi:hypothetical protein
MRGCTVQTAVGHKHADTVVQVARSLQHRDERRKKNRQRKGASGRGHKDAPASDATHRPVERCLEHVRALQAEFSEEIGKAHIDLEGTPTEKFWANPAVGAERRARLQQNLGVVFPQQLNPLCSRLHWLSHKVRRL